jgi:hypothetical protein
MLGPLRTRLHPVFVLNPSRPPLPDVDMPKRDLSILAATAWWPFRRNLLFDQTHVMGTFVGVLDDDVQYGNLGLG